MRDVHLLLVFAIAAPLARARFDTSSKLCKQAGEEYAARVNHTGGLCGSAELLSRSYLLKARWPFDPLPLVMEVNPGTCDFYQAPVGDRRSVCCDLTGDFHEPERVVAEAIASFLIGCSRGHGRASSHCTAVDLGSNNGWFSAYMLQLGAHVISVEPQTDFAMALLETALLNCWAKRSKVHNARVCTSNDFGCRRTVLNASSCHTGGWRLGGGKSQLSHEYGPRCSGITGLPESVGSVLLNEILLQGAMAGRKSSPPSGSLPELHLLKIDVDGPEGSWMREIDRMLTQRELSIRTIIIEASFVPPSLMARFQSFHGFTFYRLDAHDARRTLTREGWDALSPPGTIARLDRYAAEHREPEAALTRFSPHNVRTAGQGADQWKPFADGVSRRDLEEELFSVRAMRHVFRAKPKLSIQHWTTLMQPLQHNGYESAPLQWVLTRDGVAGDLTDSTLPANDWREFSPEYQHAKRQGHVPRDVEAAFDAIKAPPRVARIPPARHDGSVRRVQAPLGG